MTAITDASSSGYLKLVRKFPLKSIRDEAQLEAATEMIDQLLRKHLDEGEQEYLDALSDLVETYENAHHAIPDASGGDVLRELMAANGLSQLQLSKKTGIAQSTISAVLSGTRSLNIRHVVTLAEFFNAGPAAFLPASSRQD